MNAIKKCQHKAILFLIQNCTEIYIFNELVKIILIALVLSTYVPLTQSNLINKVAIFKKQYLYDQNNCTYSVIFYCIPYTSTYTLDLYNCLQVVLFRVQTVWEDFMQAIMLFIIHAYMYLYYQPFFRYFMINE